MHPQDECLPRQTSGYAPVPPRQKNSGFGPVLIMIGLILIGVALIVAVTIPMGVTVTIKNQSPQQSGDTHTTPPFTVNSIGYIITMVLAGIGTILEGIGVYLTLKRHFEISGR